MGGGREGGREEGRLRSDDVMPGRSGSGGREGRVEGGREGDEGNERGRDGTRQGRSGGRGGERVSERMREGVGKEGSNGERKEGSNGGRYLSSKVPWGILASMQYAVCIAQSNPQRGSCCPCDWYCK